MKLGYKSARKSLKSIFLVVLAILTFTGSVVLNPNIPAQIALNQPIQLVTNASAAEVDKLPFENGKSALISRGYYGTSNCANHGCGVRRAIDFATTENIKIVASRSGTVLNKGCYSIAGYGCFVMIKNNLGDVDTYAHMKDNSIIAPGLDQPVSQGQVLGEIGSTGEVTGQHVHFERDKTNGTDRKSVV